MAPAPSTISPGGVRFRGVLAWALVAAVLLGGTVLEVWGIELPRIAGVSGPLGEPATLAAIALFAVCLRRRARRLAHPSPGDGRGMGIEDLAPLALAVLGVRVALDLGWPLLRRFTAPPVVSLELSGPLLRLGMGGVLLAGLAALGFAVPAFRRRCGASASARHLRSGLCFTISVVAVVYAVLLLLGMAVAGPGQVRLQLPSLLPATVALVLGQVAIAFGEEAFYRGVLQGEVASLLARFGFPGERQARVAAMGLVSALFAFQHVGPGMPADAFLATLLYSFAMSMLFGVLFELTGNLAVCTLAHLFNNLTVLGLGPKLAAPGSIEAFGGGVYVAAYLLITFSFLFLLSRDKSPSLAAIRPS